MDRPADPERRSIEENAVETSPTRDWGDDWVHELVAMTRPGAEINLRVRGLADRVVPFQFDDFS